MCCAESITVLPMCMHHALQCSIDHIRAISHVLARVCHARQGPDASGRDGDISPSRFTTCQPVRFFPFPATPHNFGLSGSAALLVLLAHHYVLMFLNH
jgi:hypothetical protein